jgi:hypothetical protein
MLKFNSDPPPAEIELRRNRAKFFYNDAKIIITAIITVTTLICLSALLIVCLKFSKELFNFLRHTFDDFTFTEQRKNHRKEAAENLKKAEVQRDRYYATIHKQALHGDKIPGRKREVNNDAELYIEA